jgi:hypothetical protein
VRFVLAGLYQIQGVAITDNSLRLASSVCGIASACSQKHESSAKTSDYMKMSARLLTHQLKLRRQLVSAVLSVMSPARSLAVPASRDVDLQPMQLGSSNNAQTFSFVQGFTPKCNAPCMQACSKLLMCQSSTLGKALQQTSSPVRLCQNQKADYDHSVE